MPDFVQRLAKEQGTALLEYCIVFMLFMTLLFGICGFAHALYAYHFVSHAAKSATRYAGVRGSTCTNDGSCVDDGSCTTYATTTCVPTYVQKMAPGGIDPNKLTTTVTWLATTRTCQTASNAPGCTVQVTVSYDFNFILPLISGKVLTLSDTSQMVIAH